MKLTRRSWLAGFTALFALFQSGPKPIKAKQPIPEWDGLPNLEHPMHMEIERVRDYTRRDSDYSYIGKFGGKQHILFSPEAERMYFCGFFPHDNRVLWYGTLSELDVVGITKVYGPLRSACPFGKAVTDEKGFLTEEALQMWAHS